MAPIEAVGVGGTSVSGVVEVARTESVVLDAQLAGVPVEQAKTTTEQVSRTAKHEEVC